MAVASVFVGLFVLLFMGAPIAIALGLPVLLAFALAGDLPLVVVAQKLQDNISAFPLMAVPFFILASDLMQHGGVARRLIRLANAIVGHLPGGLAIAGIMACAFFAAISGSSAATVAAIGSLMIPGMIEAGYDKRFAVGCMACAGSLGILIPPSIPMVIYGYVTETSVGKLFIAGVIPGIFFALTLMFVTYVYARMKGMQRGVPATWAERWVAVKDATWSLLLPVLIVVGIYGIPEVRLGPIRFSGTGAFTPTEAAAVSVLYAFLVGLFVHRELKWRDMAKVLGESMRKIAMLMFLIANAILFGFFLTSALIPQKLSAGINSMGLAPWQYLLAVNVLLFFAGDFMDAVPIILIFIPVLFPTAMALGIDPVHLGIVVTINMEMGAITPPVGVNLYVASAISGMPLYRVLRAAAPWILVVVFVLLVVTYIPIIATFLPKVMYGSLY